MLTVRAYPRGSLQRRLLISISKQVVKGAVQRNRVKRRIRSALRPHLVGSTADYLVVARRGAGSLTYQALAAELTGALERTVRRDADSRRR